ncbi:DNA polymerase III subunit beta [Paenibacillus glycanilyticus]|uniref:Beta sliding clamp n=1 Tax=Paenibacillus glycanilyticus TaxID=126569 RepID=A0ABQ6G999_9BACL|nr:DNA polymerase III subunit beta [Paenibacillus glycanilyticus]GLX67539.1 DNA polymerase III subunit beta [Paenibacillus glycanilyticus]
MLVQIRKDTLINAVQHVLRAVAVNSPIPILQGIDIHAGTDGIILTASNISMTIQYKIPQDNVSTTVQRAGAVVIPARYFYDVIRKLNNEVVVLELKDKLVLTVMSGGSRVSLCGMDSTEFPSLNNEELYSKRMQINNLMFRSAIKQVAIVASTSETRPVLTGVFFECDNDSLNLIATDGIRLAYQNLHNKNSSNDNFKAIIPAKNLYEISKMLIDDDVTTEIEVSGNRIQFKASGLKVQSALIDGTFPSIKNVVPKSYLCEILVNRIGLLQAVECVTVLASESVIKLVADPNKLKLLSSTAEVGDIENEVSLMEMLGDGFNISLNGKFLIDILRNCDCTSLRLKYAGKNNPIAVLPNDSGISTLFLITPIRTHT